MAFDTVTFWLFFVFAFAAWRWLPFAFAKAVALGFSLLFYAWWSPWYLPLIVLSAAVDYRAGAKIHAATEPRVRRNWLLLSIGVNLGLLGTFKYGGFALENAGAVLSWAGVTDENSALAAWLTGTVPWVVPVGISFYTFQTLSYSIDLYRRRMQPAASFSDFFLTTGAVIRIRLTWASAAA